MSRDPYVWIDPFESVVRSEMLSAQLDAVLVENRRKAEVMPRALNQTIDPGTPIEGLSALQKLAAIAGESSRNAVGFHDQSPILHADFCDKRGQRRRVTLTAGDFLKIRYFLSGLREAGL